MVLLTLDPSLTSTGWSVIKEEGERRELLACGCIRTDPPPRIAKTRFKEGRSKTKRDPSVDFTEHETGRAMTIAQELVRIATDYGVEEVVFENPAGSQSAQAATGLGIAKGLVVGACIGRGLPVRAIRAGVIRQRLLGAVGSSLDDKKVKALVEEKVVDAFPNFEELTTETVQLKKGTKRKRWAARDREAAADAVAVFMGDRIK